MLALGNVDLGADPSHRPSELIVRDEDTCLDPPDLTVAYYAKFQDELSVTVGESADKDGVQPRQIVRMHQGTPIFACNLQRAIGQTINGRATR